ncbi:MAG: DUF3489 domain-containing protein [Roseibium sp.]
MNFVPDWLTLPKIRKTAISGSKLHIVPRPQPGPEVVVGSDVRARNSTSIGYRGSSPPPSTASHSCSAKHLEILDLIDMPNGIRCSVLAQRLGWKVPSVRAAISRLRATGYEIETLASSSTGETIYRCRRQTAPQTKTKVGG